MASNLHILMIPLMCPGHLIPMVDMAKLIAQHSVSVTIVITPRNAVRYGAVLDRAVASGLPIRTLKLRFPSETRIPEGCESLDDLPTFELAKDFFDASSKLQKPLEDALQELKITPSCVISDKHLTWTADLAGKFRIPRVIFDGMSCFTELANHNLFLSKIHETVSDSEPFVLPGLPDRITMTKSQLPGLFNPGKGQNFKKLTSLLEKIRSVELDSYGTVINSFEDLERKYIDEYRKVKKGKVWCIGPFSQSNKNELDKSQRGSKGSNDDYGFIIRWLDSQRKGSVIYACLGSLTRLPPPQFIELAKGLEDSGFPFILVLKGGRRTEEIEKWLSEDGFEKRVKERAILVREWAPQVLVLSHRAVGGFLTHCGWNSTIEGVCAGVPMVTWPQFADQFYNERLAVEVVGTGVEVGARKALSFGDEDEAEMQVKREDVCKAVKAVMDEGIEGEKRREKARYYRDMAEKAMEEGGSSQLNLKLFIEDILHHMSKGLTD